jgi:CBS domain-containing protein
MGEKREEPERADGRRPALTMYSPLSAILRREPVTVPLRATVREALETMERARVGSIVVTDPERGVPLGIFTLRDLLRRVTLPGGDLQEPIACVMTSGLITLPPEATAYRAALTMARHGVRRVVVVDGEGRLVGVLSQGDLFALQRVGVKEVSNEIREAGDTAGLRRASLEIRRLADTLMAQGVSAETLTQYVSTLNDLLTVRIIELTADEFELPTVPMCWIALGSEGRLEQTFTTDQDNGVIFEADPADAGRVREGLLPFARAVNRKLDACGFPLCKGDVMAGNPRWCLTLDEWRQAFRGWIDEGQPQALLNACIFFDLRPIYGDESLAERLRGWLLSATASGTTFQRLMAENALQCQPPLGILRDFVYDGSREFPHTIDLKKHGSLPFVDAARVLSLANRVPCTSTAQRLRAVGEVLRIDDAVLEPIIDGFYFIHLLRLRNQCRLRGPRAEANRIDPAELGRLDRHALKEAFRQARKLQARLVVAYGL